MKCPLCERKRLRKAGSCGRQRAAFFSRGNGADDEGTGSDIKSGCREVEVVGSGRNYGRDGPHDAALAGAAELSRAIAGYGITASERRARSEWRCKPWSKSCSY